MLKFIHSNNYHSDNDLEIIFDEAGAALLLSTVEKVLKSRDHEHLTVNPYGNEGLTIERGTDCPIKLATFRFSAAE